MKTEIRPSWRSDLRDTAPIPRSASLRLARSAAGAQFEPENRLRGQSPVRAGYWTTRTSHTSAAPRSRRASPSQSERRSGSFGEAARGFFDSHSSDVIMLSKFLLGFAFWTGSAPFNLTAAWPFSKRVRPGGRISFVIAAEAVDDKASASGGRLQSRERAQPQAGGTTLP